MDNMYTITEDQRRRIERLSHLRSAIMHIEAAMAIDSDKWDYTDVQDARDARDTVRNLIHTMENKNYVKEGSGN